MMQLKDVQFSFKNSDWHASYSLKLNPIDSLGILGTSGSGKTTLLNLIAGFIFPQSGQIIFNNIDYTNISPDKRPITMLFQDHNLFSHLNIFDNIAIGINPSLKLTNLEVDQTLHSIERVGLKGLNKRFIHQLSGGQKQRVAIARSLVRKNPILILDEPFSFLDFPLKIEMLELVKDLQKEQKFILIIVTHDFNDCLRICTKTAFLDNGKILHIDSTKHFDQNTTHLNKIQQYLGKNIPKRQFHYNRRLFNHNS